LFEVYNIAIIPLVLGLVELFKRAGVSAKYSPFVAVILGVLAGVFYISSDIKEGVIIGLMLGLSASGLYSGTKNLVKSSGK
jgi:uncharacterized membrane protein YGL010W